MVIRARCPGPDCRRWLETAPPGAGESAVKCPHCLRDLPLTACDADAEGPIAQCAVCGGREFFLRKDFPQKLGLAIVILFAVVASVFYYFRIVAATYAALAVPVMIDAVVYLVVGQVTVCYRCRAEYRRVGYNQHHANFDLATSEKYSQPWEGDKLP